jgi:hypothetical protein
MAGKDTQGPSALARHCRHGSAWPNTVRVDGHGNAGTVGMDRSLGAARHRRQLKLSRGLVSQGRQVWKGVLRSELLGLRTAGSAWSGSHPAVCESAWTRQAWGAWPISHWHGRIGMDREERCGQVRSGRHGPTWNGQSGLFMAGMVPQGSVLCGEHGRLGSASMGLACFGRQRSDGQESHDSASHGRQRMARRGHSAHGRHGPIPQAPPRWSAIRTAGMDWLRTP